MRAASALFLVIDQTLVGFEGHHFEYDVSVLLAAQALGLGTAIAVHRDYPAAGDRLAGAPVVGRFDTGWNAGHRSPLVRAGRAVLSRLPATLRGPALRATHVLRRGGVGGPDVVALSTSSFGDEVFALIGAQTLTACDHVFIHTLGTAELLSLARALTGAAAARPHLHVVLRRDPPEDAPQRAALTGAFDILRAAHVHLYADTPALARAYDMLGGEVKAVLPIPFRPLAAPPQPALAPDGPVRIGYLGGARGEKGFDLLPDMVMALADSHLRSGKAQFVIQSNFAFSLEEPRMARAHKRLAAWPKAQVRLIDAELTQEAFQALLQQTDIVLLPYRAEPYRLRSSGILIQAAAAGIPTVVPAGTWLSETAPVGACVVFDRPAGLADAIAEAVVRYPELSATARAAAPDFARRHSAQRLVQTLLAQATESNEDGSQA